MMELERQAKMTERLFQRDYQSSIDTNTMNGDSARMILLQQSQSQAHGFTRSNGDAMHNKFLKGTSSVANLRKGMASNQ